MPAVVRAVRTATRRAVLDAEQSAPLLPAIAARSSAVSDDGVEALERVLDAHVEREVGAQQDAVGARRRDRARSGRAGW